MKTYGLIGYPLGHSFSKKYFSDKFKNQNITSCEYKNFEIDNIEKFEHVIRKNPGLIGLNVTIPYKEKVIAYLDDINEAVKEIGAVNTVKVVKSDSQTKLIGYNTDVIGFENSLAPMLNSKHKKALILGTGGASKAIKYVLKKLSIEFVSASIEELKANEIRYSDINKDLMDSHLIIINATPLGTYPKTDSCPDIPYEHITPNHVLFDLVYNPEETLFLKKGKQQGAKIKNGLEMLHGQAEAAWEIWNS